MSDNTVDSEYANGNSLYRPPESVPDPGAMYPRVERLEHDDDGEDVLLATFEHYLSGDPDVADQPYFPVYRSTDGGETWAEFSEIHDTQNDWGLRFQPNLFELSQDVGPWSAGTVLAVGNSIPDDLSQTQIDLYASEDHGETWAYVSTIAEGGQAIPQTGSTPVWEPELALDADGDLVVYFADERHRDDGYNQLVAHRVSTDGGQTWGEEVFDAAIDNGEDRPGMPVVTRLPDGRYVMVYEIVGPTYEGGVFAMVSENGRDWGDPADLGSPVKTAEGYQACNGPYVTWTPAGGEDGTIIVSAKTVRDEDRERAPDSGEVLLATQDFEEFADWQAIPAPLSYADELEVDYQMIGWTVPLLPSRDGERLLEATGTYVDEERLEVRYAIDDLDLSALQ